SRRMGADRETNIRVELTAEADLPVPFRFDLGDPVRTRSTGHEGNIVGGRYLGPVPPTGVALAYAIEYVVRPERGPDFGALEADLEWRGSSPRRSPLRRSRRRGSVPLGNVLRSQNVTRNTATRSPPLLQPLPSCVLNRGSCEEIRSGSPSALGR